MLSSSLAKEPFLNFNVPSKILPDFSWIRPRGFQFLDFAAITFLQSKAISFASYLEPERLGLSIYIPNDRVVHLDPRAPCSLFFAFCDSQICGGIILCFYIDKILQNVIYKKLTITIITILKSNRMRWVGYVARMGCMKLSIGEPENIRSHSIFIVIILRSSQWFVWLQWIMNWKGLGKKGSWLNRGILPEFSWWHWV
jgi:hypothetical protein